MTDSVETAAEVALSHEERAEKALTYLVNTDLKHAMLKARQNRLQEVRKTILAFGFAKGAGSAEACRQAAHATKEYIDHIDSQEETDIEFHTVDNRRKTALAITDMYRTFSANQRRG